MFYVVIASCVIVATFFVSRHHAMRSRLVEKDIERVVARKLATSDYAMELSRLREENAVMRNLLLDLVENEAHPPASQPHTDQADLARLRNTKIRRYREILAESVHVLQQRDGQRISECVSSYMSEKSEKS